MKSALRVILLLAAAHLNHGCADISTDTLNVRHQSAIDQPFDSTTLSLTSSTLTATFSVPTPVYATGTIAVESGIPVLKPYTAYRNEQLAKYVYVSVLSSSDGLQVNLIEGNLTVETTEAIKIYSAAGKESSIQELSGRKVFITGIFDPQNRTITSAQWIEEVHPITGKCGYESGEFRTTASGCRWMADKTFPVINTFLSDEVSQYLSSISPVNGTSPSPLAPAGTFDGGYQLPRMIGPGRGSDSGNTFLVTGSCSVPVPEDNRTCPEQFRIINAPTPAAYPCTQLGPDFRLPTLAEYNRLTKARSLKQLFHPFQTKIDFNSQFPIYGIFLQEGSGNPYLYVPETRAGNPNKSASGGGLIFCLDKNPVGKELGGRFITSQGPISATGRSIGINTNIKALSVLDAHQAKDVRVTGLVYNGCTPSTLDNETGLVLRRDSQANSHYLGQLRFTTTGRYKLDIKKRIQGQDNLVATMDLPSPFAQAKVVGGQTKTICQADLTFKSEGSKLSLTLNRAFFGEYMNLSYNFGNPFTLEHIDPTPLDRGAVGTWLQIGNQTSNEGSKQSLVRIGLFRAVSLDTSSFILNPDVPLIGNPNGEDIPESLPSPGIRSALLDDINTTKVTFSGAWVGVAVGHKNTLKSVGSGPEFGSTAVYKFTNLTPGKYLIAATWQPSVGSSNAVPYRAISDLESSGTFKVDQKIAPIGIKDNGVQFQSIRVIVVGTAKMLSVEVGSSLGGSSQADAIRLTKLD